MANRRCLHTLSRFISSNRSLQSLKPLPHLRKTLTLPDTLSSPILTAKFDHISTYREPICYARFSHARHLSSDRRDVSDEEEEEEEEEDEDEDEDVGEVDYEDHENVSASKGNLKRTYTPEEREKEAAEIGYKVIGPLDRSDKPFKSYEPVFAVVQMGSHQFKVSNWDYIYTERLKFCEVNDRLILNKVLMLGSKTQTIIGRPILPDAVVHAVVEEHALDAKVIIFKKKRRKNYRRTKGHRQELTRLRIIDIQGVEKPEKAASGKTDKAAVKRPEKVPVAA